MHNHEDNNSTGGHDSKMMWLMMLGCFLPIILVAFTGGGVGRSSIWWLLGAGAVMLGLHAFGMRGHGSHGHQANADPGTDGNQPATTPTASQANPANSPSAANPGPMKDGHKHDCCQ